jgi:hypothetical protein
MIVIKPPGTGPPITIKFYLRIGGPPILLLVLSEPGAERRGRSPLGRGIYSNTIHPPEGRRGPRSGRCDVWNIWREPVYKVWKYSS